MAEGLTDSPSAADATSATMKDSIVAFVAEYDWVSFVELLNHLEPRFGVRGDLAFSLNNDPNLIVWVGVSEEFTAALRQLLAEKRVFFHPGSVMAYAIDGGLLQMPVASRPPKGGYRTPHWIPISLRVVPLDKKKKR